MTILYFSDNKSFKIKALEFASNKIEDLNFKCVTHIANRTHTPTHNIEGLFK